MYVCMYVCLHGFAHHGVIHDVLRTTDVYLTRHSASGRYYALKVKRWTCAAVWRVGLAQSLLDFLAGVEREEEPNRVHTANLDHRDASVTALRLP